MKITTEQKKMYETILQAFGPSGCEQEVVKLLEMWGTIYILDQLVF